ncbi:hypothetical protein [Clostridium sp.]|uniref:hypothetical protein n=1 Tax=Clostridium sp. TaxID=1506 RepID=UPI0034643FC7
MISNTNTWIFNDRENNLWRFLLDEKGNMSYNNMYSHNKWSRETRLDRGVREFDVYKDKSENIHIAYRNDTEIKYCLWDGKQWLGKVIYEFHEQNIKDIRILVLERIIHLFFISSNENNNLGEIIHYTVKEDEVQLFTIASVKIKDEEDNYKLECKDEKSIYLLYIDNSEGDNEIKGSIYDGQWSEPQTIYYTNGEEVRISTKVFNNKLYILNLSIDEEICSLEEIHLEENGDIKYDKIYNALSRVDNICFIEKDDILWALWNEGEEILCSNLRDKWSKPQVIYNIKDEKVNFYKSMGINLENREVTCHRVFGRNYPIIDFILPNEEIPTSKKKALEGIHDYISSKYMDNHNNVFNPKEYGKPLYKEDQIGSENFSKDKEKESGKNANKIIATLNMQLQQKESLCEDLQDRLDAINLKNKKSEQNIIEFKRVFEETGKEVQEIRSSLEEVTKERDNLKDTIKDITMESNTMKEKYQKNLIEIKSLKEQIEEIIRGKELVEEETNKDKLRLNEEINKNKLKFNEEISSLTKRYREIQNKLEEKSRELAENNKELEVKDRKLVERNKELEVKFKELELKSKELEVKNKKLESITSEKNNMTLKLKEIILENDSLKRTLHEGYVEREGTLRELEITNSHREELKKALEDANKEIHMINLQKEKLISIVREDNIEKNRLRKELESEINRSIISKILNKRGES